MSFMVENMPMPDSEAVMGPKQRVKAMASLGKDQCLTIDVSDEAKPERVRSLWVVAAQRNGISVRTRMMDEPSGRTFLRIWRVDA